jgi:hypothetical protein
LSIDQRAAILAIDEDIPDELAATLQQAQIMAVPAELADGDGQYRQAWLMPTTLRDFLEKRQPEPPYD